MVDAVAWKALLAHGHAPEVLTAEETEQLRKKWRRVFARPLFEQRGVWSFGGYDWHVFSYELTYALAGHDAMQAYRQCDRGRLVVLPNPGRKLCACVIDAAPPDLQRSHDVYVFPADLAWTMVFTHEDGWLGPYFSRAVWVADPPRKEPATEPERSKRKRKRRGSRR